MSIAAALVMSGSRAFSGQVPGAVPNVCGRTFEVSDAIVTAAGVATCAHVTGRHLREITSLDLQGRNLASLGAQDFNGLVRLHALDLSDNQLTALPRHVFDELVLLRTLRLDGNLLRTLPADLFDRLWMLEEVTLEDNPLLVLPAGMLAETWRFDGSADNAVLPGWGVDAGPLDRFLAGVSTVEEFIRALPAQYKERFGLVFASESPAHEHVSGAHPRIVSIGEDGRFIFSWNTDPAAPPHFRDGIEFLRRGDTEWSAGIVDFSGATPTITEPRLCKSCHGPLNKPLWGAYGNWEGTDFDERRFGEALERAYESTNPRLEPLDFSASHLVDGRRFLRAGCDGCLAAVEEVGSVMSWRHAEVLFRRLKARRDFRQFAENTVCESSPAAIQAAVLAPFDVGDHNLAALAHTGEFIQGASARSFFTNSGYFYGFFGRFSGALTFLLVVDLWEQEPIVRKLYREVSNTETVGPASRGEAESASLYYPLGTATAEDELIMKLGLHFGNGSRSVIAERDRQNARPNIGGVVSAAFFQSHLDSMAPRVCDALRNTKPGNLTVAVADGDAVLRWDAPADLRGLSGYRILRAADGGTPTRYEDTGATGTTWTDSGLSPGDYVWTVQALYDGYPSPESNAVRATASGSPPEVEGPTSFTTVEGDTAVATLTATDTDTQPSGLVWTMAGGADRGHFRLSEDGELAFRAAKDYEAPDDAGGDGTYDLMVRVSDGSGEDTAAVRVSLSNRNEAPTANAGGDQPGVEESATVTLSGAGEDPDARDTLRYAWTQTGGAEVTLSAPSEAVTTFTAPGGLAENAVLTFRLRVTDTGGLAGEDTVTVTVVAAEEPGDPALTASFRGMPASHDGTTPFTFELRFSEQVALSYVTLRDSSFTVANGRVAGVRRLDPPSNVGWEITLDPTSREDITVVLPGGRSCDAPGAICTPDGRPLTGSARATVEATGESETPLTASFNGVPLEHDGETAFNFELRFSEEVALSYVTLRDSSFTVTNGRVTRARRLDRPSNMRWMITVAPESSGDITIALPGGRSCDTTGAICTAGAKQLSNSPSATVR